jgi:hypothetical protein
MACMAPCSVCVSVSVSVSCAHAAACFSCRRSARSRTLAAGNRPAGAWWRHATPRHAWPGRRHAALVLSRLVGWLEPTDPWIWDPAASLAILTWRAVLVLVCACCRPVIEISQRFAARRRPTSCDLSRPPACRRRPRRCSRRPLPCLGCKRMVAVLV